MNSDPLPITSAGLQPPSYIIERFVRYFPLGTPFSFLLNRLHEIATTNSRFHLCDMRQQCAIADAIEDVEELSTIDRIVFCSSPADTRRPGEGGLINAFARLVAEGKGVTILDMPDLDLDILRDDFTADRAYLSKVEKLHKGIVIWMWLSYRFRSIFIERDLAIHVKTLTEARIEETLQRLSFDFQKMRQKRERAILKLLTKEEEEKAAKAAKGEVANETTPEKGATQAAEDVTDAGDPVANSVAFESSDEMVQDAEDASAGAPLDHVELPINVGEQAATQQYSLDLLISPPVLPLALGSPGDPATEPRMEARAAAA